MSALNKVMTRGFISPEVHGILDYPLAAILIAGPLVLDFDSTAATVIGLVFGAGAAILALTTDWQTGVYRIIPPIVHGYVDVVVTAAMIVLPFAVGFDDQTPALVFYLVVGGAGLLATLATRFPSRMRHPGAVAAPHTPSATA